MKYCQSCGAPMRDGAKFCSSCGAHDPGAVPAPPAAPAICPVCGAPLEEGSLFCQSCGAKVTDGPQAQPAPAVPGAPQKPPKKKKKKGLIITIIVLAAALIGVGAFFLIRHFTGGGDPLKKAEKIGQQGRRSGGLRRCLQGDADVPARRLQGAGRRGKGPVQNAQGADQGHLRRHRGV